MKIDDRFHGISTLVSSSTALGQSQGTGFFYQQLGEREKAAQPGYAWRQVTQTWLVTNRHVVLPRAGDQELVPDSFTFNLRRRVEDRIEWDPIVLSRGQLLERARFHTDREVDVAIVSVQDLIVRKLGFNVGIVWYGYLVDEIIASDQKYAP
ncbi:MAG TPA: hypothetical protein VFR12_06795 [Pyrinomonadaceae bacterium]|nr:hypothetical protein [Pyrinomonadaceae bacterium]